MDEIGVDSCEVDAILAMPEVGDAVATDLCRTVEAEGVASRAACQDVGAGSAFNEVRTAVAIKTVAAGAAGQPIGGFVAVDVVGAAAPVSGNRIAADKDQPLDVWGDAPADVGEDGVDAGAGGLDDTVRGVRHEIGIAARATAHQ